MTKFKTWQGDCIEVLKTKPTNSVDSLVTDPPAGISFMGKAWDSDKGGRDEWIAWMEAVSREMLRVMKPGAHGFVWALPRTSHWTAFALERAGFEIRDIVHHLFGSGFPKSMDISKAIDKAAGAEREVVGSKIGSPGYAKPSLDGQMGGAFALHGHSLAELYTLRDQGIEKTIDNRNIAAAIARGERMRNDANPHAITAPATPEAKQWQGYGTALKPAAEHWILVRKPLGEKTVAKNVLKHGTGGLNIDASRIGGDGKIQKRPPPSGNPAPGHHNNDGPTKDTWRDSADKGWIHPWESNPQGRFPAHLVLSGDAPEELDRQSGVSTSTQGKKAGGKTFHGVEYESKDRPQFGDTGGASRFFYVAKASKKDKGADNTHPTVKNTALMRYLITMITPPGGIVLDPFMGSGSTGVAALKAGFRFFGIEQQAEYHTIAERRLQECLASSTEADAAPEQSKLTSSGG